MLVVGRPLAAFVVQLEAFLSICLEFDEGHTVRLDGNQTAELILPIPHRDMEVRDGPFTEPFDLLSRWICRGTTLLPDVKDRAMLPIEGEFSDLVSTIQSADDQVKIAGRTILKVGVS